MIFIRKLIFVIIITSGIVIIILFARYNSSLEVLRIFKKATEDRDIKKLWEISSRVERNLFGNNYDNFKASSDNFFREYPEHAQDHISAHLGKVKLINLNRVWVKTVNPSASDIKGYYLIRENGEWKLARLTLCMWTCYRDMQFIAEALTAYYADNSRLPSSLYNLAPRYIQNIPLDIFNEKNKPYGYKVLGEKMGTVYSVGLDGKDDHGEVKYDTRFNISFAYLDFGKGDIVEEFEIAK